MSVLGDLTFIELTAPSGVFAARLLSGDVNCVEPPDGILPLSTKWWAHKSDA
jgi:hypothetical protein